MTSPDRIVRWVQRQLKVVLLPGFALVLLAAMWLAVGWQLTQERRMARHEAVGHAQALARVLSEHVSHILRQTDHATQLFKLKYEEGGGRLRLADFMRRNGLLDSVLPARLNLPIALVDKAGNIVDSANGHPPGRMGSTPSFRALAASNADAPLFSTKVVDARTHRWQIQVARRLNGPDGQFAGMLAILVDPAFFVDDYDRLNVDDDGALVLTSRDAGLSTGRMGERLFSSDQLDFAPAPGAAGREEILARAPLDAVRRIYGASEMPRYSLTAVVGVTEREAMAVFERHRAVYVGTASVATVLIAAIVAVLMKQSAQLRASMRAARNAQATLRAAADGSLDAFMVLKAWPAGAPRPEDFTIADLNTRAAAMLRRPRMSLLGQKLFALLPRYRQAGVFEHYAAAMGAGQPLEEEVEVNIEGEAPRWLHHQIVPLEGGVAVTWRDITARKQEEQRLRESEMALRESEARLRTIADTLPAMIAYIDAAQVYRFNNLAYDREFGHNRQDMLGKTIRETVGEKRYAFLQPYIERALQGETLVFEEHDDAEGVDRALEVTYIPQRGEDGAAVVGFHVMRHDITSQKREKKRLLKLSQVDALTGLTNRAGFMQKLDAAMRASADENHLMAVMYMDIDHFKPVNDTYGHNVGDALLKAFSARLTHTLRASDTIARLGGDEFTIILETIARPEDASLIAAKIVAAMRAPFDLDGVKVSVSTSIGLAYFRDGAPDPDALLKQADMLLYQAKQAGRDTWRAAA